MIILLYCHYLDTFFDLSTGWIVNMHVCAANINFVLLDMRLTSLTKKKKASPPARVTLEWLCCSDQDNRDMLQISLPSSGSAEIWSNTEMNLNSISQAWELLPLLPYWQQHACGAHLLHLAVLCPFVPASVIRESSEADCQTSFCCSGWAICSNLCQCQRSLLCHCLW